MSSHSPPLPSILETTSSLCTITLLQTASLPMKTTSSPPPSTQIVKTDSASRNGVSMATRFRRMSISLTPSGLMEIALDTSMVKTQFLTDFQAITFSPKILEVQNRAGQYYGYFSCAQ